MLTLLQQNPIIVDVIKQPAAARDISFDVVVGMFAMAGAFLLAAAVGSLVVAGLTILYKRWRDTGAPPSTHSHTRLGISERI